MWHQASLIFLNQSRLGHLEECLFYFLWLDWAHRTLLLQSTDFQLSAQAGGAGLPLAILVWWGSADTLIPLASVKSSSFREGLP